MYASSVAKSWNPAGSVHGILQARILERVTICYSRGSSWPRDQTHLSCTPTLTGRFFTTAPPGHLGNPLCLALGLKKDCLLDNSRANHDSITLMANQVVHFTPMAWSFLTPAMWEGRIIHPHPMSHLPLPFHHLPVWDSGLSATCRGRYRQSIHNVYTVWELSFHPKQKALAAWL